MQNDSAHTVPAHTGDVADRAPSGVEACWYVMRDLKRPNAKQPAWSWLSGEGFDVFTPLVWKAGEQGGRRVRKQVPAVHGLLFVRSTRERLDPIVDRTATLQYRYVRGAAQGTPMTVPVADMDRFIGAVTSTISTEYFQPGEVTPGMYGRRIRIVGGPLDGYEGHLLSVRGLRRRKLIVELPGLLTAAVEVAPDLIQLL